MVSRKLQRARNYVRKNLPLAAEELPAFHLTGGIGWINDPNGFAPYQGEYHLFYQYYPYDVRWGPMHWGHAKTRDFIRWEQLPPAMAPDAPYDSGGCFSGSAVEMPDGRQLLMYTGVRKLGKHANRQTQCIAIGDGVNYEKYPGNPVIGTDQIPAGASLQDFRDPHIRYENGKYRAVVGSKDADGSGSILLYESSDAIHWEYLGKVASCGNQYGKMWECPDLFPLDGKTVLLVSPQEMTGDGEFHPGNANVCLIGTWDEAAHRLDRESVQAVDYGLDFYAMQTLAAFDGRRILIGWMQNWQTVAAHPEGLHFLGQMTIPRELCIRNGRLVQNPVRELESCRCGEVRHSHILLQGQTTLPGIRGRFLDLTVTLAPEGECYHEFTLQLAQDDRAFTQISFRPAGGTICIDRSRSGVNCDIVNTREFSVDPRGGQISLRLILDRYSVELFVNGGEQAASTILYTPLTADGIRFSCEGSAWLDVEKYDLDPASTGEEL